MGKKKAAERADWEQVRGDATQDGAYFGDKPETDLSADQFIGTYKTSTVLNVREAPKKDAKIIYILRIDTPVRCDGMYGTDEDARFLHIAALVDDLEIEGFCDSQFLIKQPEVEK